MKALFVVLKEKKATIGPADARTARFTRQGRHEKLQDRQQLQPRPDQGIDHVQRRKRDAQGQKEKGRYLQRAGQPLQA